MRGTTLQCKEEKTLGVVINGGAFYGGAFSTGFLACFGKNNINISQYVGVSSGFFASMLSIAGLHDRGFFGDLNSPLYSDTHNFNVFRRFLDFYTPKAIDESKLDKQELLKEVNNKLSAVATRTRFKKGFPCLQHDLIGGFSDWEDFNQAQLASGSIPWFAWPWPHKYRGFRYYDGILGLKRPERFLSTDIKMVIQPHLTSPVQQGSCYNIVSGEVAGLNKLVNSPAEDIDANWLKGYAEAEKFLDKERDSLGL